MPRRRSASAPIRLMVLLCLTALLTSTTSQNANAATYITYRPETYNVFNGKPIAGTLPTSLESVDSDCLVVESAPSETDSASYHPSSYTLLGNTLNISGTIEDMASNDSTYAAFQSYGQPTRSLYPHQETTPVGATTYYLLEQNGSDSFGITFSADASTIGRKLLGKFVYPLIGLNFLPASNWTVRYRTFKDHTNVAAHANIDILTRTSNGSTRAIIASAVANSTNIQDYWSTVSGTYPWQTYNVTDETDYLEIDYYVEVTAAKSGCSVYLTADDNSLNPSDQTSVTNICLSDVQMVQLELNGTSDPKDWIQLSWLVDGAWTTDSVNVTLQLYNYTAGAYPLSGEGFTFYASSSSPGFDECQEQAMTASLKDFLDSTGNWKIKVEGTKKSDKPFDLKIDLVETNGIYYSEYSTVTDLNFSSIIAAVPTQLDFIIVSQYNVSLVNVTLQVWNFTSSAYSTAGEGFLQYTSAEVNETKRVTINTDPQHCVSNGNVRIRIIGASSDPKFQQEINQVELLYNYGVYIHDIAISGITLSANEIAPGRNAQIHVLVENKGASNESFSITLFCNETCIEEKTIANMARDTNVTLEFNWNTTSFPEGTYVLNANTSTVQGEIKTDDNTYVGPNLTIVADGQLPFSYWITIILTLSLASITVLAFLIYRWQRTSSPRKNPNPMRKTGTFSRQFGLSHEQIKGKKMLLEFNPSTDYAAALAGFALEAKKNNESLFVLTSKNSAIHTLLTKYPETSFLLLTPTVSSREEPNRRETLLPATDLSLILDSFMRIRKNDEVKNISLLFDSISDMILKSGFERTYKFTSFLLETISSSNITALLLFNPTAHDQAVSSSIRGLFQSRLTYPNSA